MTENILVNVSPPRQVVIHREGQRDVVVNLPTGPKGEKGDTGEPGEPGPQGIPGSAGSYYVHPQVDPSATWEYEHGLGKNPAVTVEGTDGAIWEGDVSYPIDNVSVRIDWDGAMSGRAFNS